MVIFIYIFIGDCQSCQFIYIVHSIYFEYHPSYRIKRIFCTYNSAIAFSQVLVGVIKHR